MWWLKKFNQSGRVLLLANGLVFNFARGGAEDKLRELHLLQKLQPLPQENLQKIRHENYGHCT
jgi:hypothetical protein